jgi:hypothetical protein
MRLLAEAENIRAGEAERRATSEASIARAVNEFLERDLLRQVDVQVQAQEGFEINANLTVKEALDRATTRIGQRFEGLPLVEASIRLTMGSAYGSVDERQTQVIHVERAVAIREVQLGTDSKRVICL